MLGVVVVNGVGEFDLDGKRATIVAYYDEIDLVVSVACSEMPDASFGDLGRDAHTEGD